MKTRTRQCSAHLVVGAACGLGWAASLRAYMSELAWSTSSVEWAGTFGAILAPGAACGALLGLRVALPGEGYRRGPWFALAGGYALVGGAKWWLRLSLGILTLGLIADMAVTVPTVDDVPLTAPRGAWVATLLTAL